MATEEQQLFGMGIKIMEGRNSVAGLGSLAMMAPSEYKFDAADVGIDHGSRFAKSLGFYEDVAWPPGHEQPGEVSDNSCARQST